jgi:DNA processing protein
MDQERVYFLALHFVPGVGDMLIRQLISYCGSAEEVFRQTSGRLLKIPGIGEATTEAIRMGKSLQRAEAELRRADKEGVQILTFTDNAFPNRLKSIDDAPSLLYVKGNLNLNRMRTVGIVGTRKATTYGKACVEELVQGLAAHEVQVISGLAYGIDIHAHKEALRHGLSTLAVLGSGLDIIYPSAHLDTAKKMVNQGALITENHFGVGPDAHNFPQRNRIIAGMSDALIVVEAGDKGGALITAEIANTYNKDVFAVPGSIHSPYSAGCNRLIKTNKASLLTSVKDLEYIMNWTHDQLQRETQLVLDLESLEPEERTLLTLMKEKKRALSIDDLSFITQHPQGKVSSLLLALEFKNKIVSMPGKMYMIRSKGIG